MTRLFHFSDLPHLAFVGATLAWRTIPIRHRLPRAARIARTLGDIWYTISRADAAHTRRNMAWGLGRTETDRLARDLFRETAYNKLLNDMLPKLRRAELTRLATPIGLEHVQPLLARRQSFILLGAHYGLNGYPALHMLEHQNIPTLAVLGPDMPANASEVYRRIVYPVRSYAHRSFDILTTNGLPQRRLLQAVQAGKALMLLGDALDEETARLQPPHVADIPFLNGTLRLKTGPVRLAQWLGLPIVPFFFRRRTVGYDMVFHAPIYVSRQTPLEEPLTHFTTLFNTYLANDPAPWAHWRHETLDQFMRPQKSTTHPQREVAHAHRHSPA